MAVLLGVLIISIRIYWIIKPAKHTICPKCETKYPKANEGPYTCSSCGANFSVDQRGNADITTPTDIYLFFFIGIATILLIVFIFTIYGFSNAWSQDLYKLTFLLLIVAVFSMYHAISNFIKHRKRYSREQ